MFLFKDPCVLKKKKNKIKMNELVSEHNGVDITPYSIYIDLPTDG